MTRVFAPARGCAGDGRPLVASRAGGLYNEPAPCGPHDRPAEIPPSEVPAVSATSSFRSAVGSVLVLAVVGARLAAAQPPLAPDEAQKRFHVAAGLEVKLFASEPLVRQPVTMTFDDRGRLWVIQYLQYPAPAGLKPVEVDQYLRTKYDRRPEPPPLGPRAPTGSRFSKTPTATAGRTGRRILSAD